MKAMDLRCARSNINFRDPITQATPANGEKLVRGKSGTRVSFNDTPTETVRIVSRLDYLHLGSDIKLYLTRTHLYPWLDTDDDAYPTAMAKLRYTTIFFKSKNHLMGDTMLAMDLDCARNNINFGDPITQASPANGEKLVRLKSSIRVSFKSNNRGHMIRTC